jgi:hypothetical protein
MNPPDRANDSRRVHEYRTEPDRTSQQMPSRDTEIITKTAYKEKHGWVSAWPVGHPNHSPVVTPEEQTRNMQRR